MNSRRILTGLLVAALALPIATTLLAAFAWALRGMGDLAGGDVLARAALGLGIVWVLSLVALILLMAVRHLSTMDELNEPPEE